MLAIGNMGTANMLGMPSSSLAIVYFVMTVLYCMQMIFLVKFSSATKHALNENNIRQLTASFKNLKYHFMSVVISIIVMVIIFVGVVASAVQGRLIIVKTV